MIHSLTGKVIEKSLDEVVISCGGVGFLVAVPQTAQGAIAPIGEETTLYTYLNVKEDALDLYGFATREEQRAFKILTTVSGVGPKAGLAILSALTPDRVALGYTQSQAAMAVAKLDTNADVQTLIKQALRLIAGGKI